MLIVAEGTAWCWLLPCQQQTKFNYSLDMINYCPTTCQVYLLCWHEKSNSSRKDVKYSCGKEQRQGEEKQDIKKRYWMTLRSFWPFWAIVLLCKTPKVWQGKQCQSRSQMELKRLSAVLYMHSMAPAEKNYLQLVSRKITAMLSVKMSPTFCHYQHNLNTQQTFPEPFQLKQRRKANCLWKKAFMCTDSL